jgi:hypothetical protein
MLIQPKPYMNKLKLRHHAFGTERRRNMSKMILERGTPFPKPIEYSDIDEAMYKWVEEHINIAYDGKRLPTYKLYSTQRLSEYLQEWDKQDETGNPIINFLTVTRELNPQKGESQGNYFNIPGHKDFAMFYIPVLQENGTEAYDKYTMKQPFSVNFLYSVSIISNKMELVNEVNELMHYEFSAINCYISPNDHPMSMTLEDVSDESEYQIDDRKYYSQTYKIKVRGYIIRKEDYKVERIPSRLLMSSHDSDAAGIINRKGKNRLENERVKFMEYDKDSPQYEQMRIDIMKNDDHCEKIPINDNDRPIEIPELGPDTTDCCPKPDKYRYKIMKVMMNFEDCLEELSFQIDKEMILTTVETTNVESFEVIINGETMSLDNNIRISEGDEITVKITRDILYSQADITLVGYDPNVAFDNENIAESSLDEPIDEEHIMINYDEN